MRVIFLDVDGVLIRLNSGGTVPFQYRVFELELTMNLEYLINCTDSYIVVSSSWRHHWKQFEQAWKQAELPWDRVIGKTSHGTDGGRSTEILMWLDSYHKDCKKGKHVTHWCAIDDEQFDMKAIRRIGKLVKTEANEGLTMDKVREAITLLS